MLFEVGGECLLEVAVKTAEYLRAKEVFVFPSGKVRKEEVQVLVAGGGMAGSALFRYFAEAGMKPVLVNSVRGSSWRCIGGGRPAFSNPDISDIANHNQEIFREILFSKCFFLFLFKTLQLRRPGHLRRFGRLPRMVGCLYD